MFVINHLHRQNSDDSVVERESATIVSGVRLLPALIQHSIRETSWTLPPNQESCVSTTNGPEDMNLREDGTRKKQSFYVRIMATQVTSGLYVASLQLLLGWLADFDSQSSATSTSRDADTPIHLYYAPGIYLVYTTVPDTKSICLLYTSDAADE